MKILFIFIICIYSKEEEELKCRTDILNSYLLIGRKIA